MELNYEYYFKNEFRPLASLSMHEIAMFECPPGYVLPLKKPDAYALYFVVRGKGVYTLGGTEFPAEEGDIFALYPGTTIKLKADKKDPWTINAVSFDGADARLMLNAARFEPKAPMHRLEGLAAKQVCQVSAAMYVFKGQEIYSTIQSTALLYSLMALLVKATGFEQSAMPPGWTGVIHFQKALEFIAENYSRPISVNDIANHVNLSRSRLYRIFLQQIFISPQQYLVEFRIREAISLLEKRSGSIKEIAQSVGIKDPLYFSTVFKQFTGKSPSAYMKNLIAENCEQGTENKETANP